LRRQPVAGSRQAAGVQTDHHRSENAAPSIRGENLLLKVIRSVTFNDGVEITDAASDVAA
jgi:hypothetical protein